MARTLNFQSPAGRLSVVRLYVSPPVYAAGTRYLLLLPTSLKMNTTLCTPLLSVTSAENVVSDIIVAPRPGETMRILGPHLSFCPRRCARAASTALPTVGPLVVKPLLERVEGFTKSTKAVPVFGGITKSLVFALAIFSLVQCRMMLFALAALFSMATLVEVGWAATLPVVVAAAGMKVSGGAASAEAAARRKSATQRSGCFRMVCAVFETAGMSQPLPSQVISFWMHLDEGI